MANGAAAWEEQANAQQRYIRNQSRINYLQNLFQGRQAEFGHGGGGARLAPELQQQARNVGRAWEVANRGGQENVALMQRLATEMAGIVRQQNELNRLGSGRSQAFETARRAQEQIDTLAAQPGADPRKIRWLRVAATDVISASNANDIPAARDAARELKARLERYVREFSEQLTISGEQLNLNSSWQQALAQLREVKADLFQWLLVSSLI